MQLDNKVPYNTVTSLEYQGGNIDELLQKGYSSMEWGTYLQWRDLKFKVKKGEHGTHLRTFVNVKTSKKGESETVPRHFVVFNREQVEEITK